MIGIIGAMPIEVEKLQSSMQNVKILEISKVKYFFGNLNGVNCVLAFSGVGKINSAVCAQTMIIKFNVDKIVNIGVAGGLLENMQTGDIVISTKAVQYDVDTSAVGDPKGFISTINILELPCSKLLQDRIINVLKYDDKLNFYEGIIATGDQFITDKNNLKDIRKNFNAIACDMETGSIAQVCYLNDINFLSIRIISDNINNDNSNIDYETFKLDSANLACCILEKSITTI